MDKVIPDLSRRARLALARGVLAVAFAAVAAGAAAAPTAIGPRPGQAAIASAHPLATAAGHEVIAAGGNAFDAAVAVSAALGVVEPFSSGLGGGGFYLLHRASDGHQTMVDARERAPAAATADMYLDAQGQVIVAKVREGALAAAIPGNPAGLAHLAARYGRLPLARSLAPAIALARDGFEADPRLAVLTERNVDKLKRDGEAARVWLIDGRAPKAGERVRNPELARTLESLAADGGESFYRGKLAKRLVDGVRKRGGIWTRADLAGYQVKERTPLIGEYRGHRVVTAPPPSSGGITIIETLNVLAGYDLERAPADLRAHLIVEAWRRAYRDRAEFLGDPDFVAVPVARLLDPHYAAGLRATIRHDRATPSELLPLAQPSAEGTSTTHFSVLDADGNRVAGTQTVNFRYGSGVMPEGTGVVLNNEMDDFSAKAGVPNGFGLVSTDVNAVAPGKRPLSSMAPTFVEGPQGIAILGTPGGSRIPSMNVLAILDRVAGGDAASMVRAPRFHHQFLPDQLQYEPGGLEPAVLEALKLRGHALREGSRRYGNLNAVTWRFGEPPLAATDPRNETLVDF
jgi:gamma-glutamyltranspeptidase/glutathione hydrolase